MTDDRLIETLRARYVADEIGIEEFEEEVDRALRWFPRDTQHHNRVDVLIHSAGPSASTVVFG